MMKFSLRIGIESECFQPGGSGFVEFVSRNDRRAFASLALFAPAERLVANRRDIEPGTEVHGLPGMKKVGDGNRRCTPVIDRHAVTPLSFRTSRMSSTMYAFPCVCRTS